MLDSKVGRRLVTIPVVFIGSILMTALLPLLLALAAVVDLVRMLGRGKPWVAVRMSLFLWLYLLGEVAGILGMLVTLPLPPKARRASAWWIQDKWIGWNLRAVETLFDLRFVVEGTEEIPPGPIILVSRHASLIDTMLPGRYVATAHGIRLRYVLKRELLVDPALDVGGHRLPNYFVKRGAGMESELVAIRSLGTDLAEHDGVLIYPEGTRFSASKLARYQARLSKRQDRMGELASKLEHTLPPRPGGTLALLEASGADVVVLAHRGLEGFARVKDMWGGEMIGSEIGVRFWRVPRSEIPEERSARVDWLFELWVEIDQWVGARRQAPAP